VGAQQALLFGLESSGVDAQSRDADVEEAVDGEEAPLPAPFITGPGDDRAEIGLGERQPDILMWPRCSRSASSQQRNSSTRLVVVDEQDAGGVARGLCGGSHEHLDSRDVILIV